MLESQIEKPAVDWAKRNGIKVKKKIFGEQLDRWFFFPEGHLFIIEFKAPKKRLTDLQYEEIKELLALGFDVEAHDDKEEAITALKRRARIGHLMDPAPIPERFYPLALGARGGGTVRGSRYGKNKHYARRFKSDEE